MLGKGLPLLLFVFAISLLGQVYLISHTRSYENHLFKIPRQTVVPDQDQLDPYFDQSKLEFEEPIRLFHITGSGTIVEGAAFVKFARQGETPSIDTTIWKPIGCATYEYTKGTCYYCSNVDSSCSNGGTLRFTQFNDEFSPSQTLSERGLSNLLKYRPAIGPYIR